MDSPLSKNRIDTHFHVFKAGVAVENARYVPQYDAKLSDWMAQAQRVGIGRGVWVQPSFLGTDNRLMVDALQAHPDMLRGIAVVSPDAGIDELQNLHHVGVRGIRLNLASLSHDIPEWTGAKQVWETLDRLGWHLEIHTDQGRLPHVLRQLPSDLALVVDHMAKPASASAHDPSLLALVERSRHAKVHVKLSGAYRLGGLDAAQLAALLMDALGPASLLWGSDWPCTNHEQFADFGELMAQAEEWIGAEHLTQVMSVNPLRLYWADQVSPP